jgi:hypothetical protein
MFLDEALSRVALLLEHGTDVLAVDCDGATVLMEPFRYRGIPTPSQCKDMDSIIAKALNIILDLILSLDPSTDVTVGNTGVGTGTCTSAAT